MTNNSFGNEKIHRRRRGKILFTTSSLCVMLLLGAGPVRVWAANKMLFSGVLHNNTSTVRSALKLGADVNRYEEGPSRKPTPAVFFHNALRGELHNPRTPRATPLMLAVMNGDLSMVKLLLRHGAAVDARDEFGFTALFMAISDRRPDIADTLLHYGANPNIGDDLHMTALCWAILMGDNAVADTLLKDRANPNQKDEDGIAPIYLATLERRTSVVKELGRYGADPNASFHGYPALHVAIAQHDAATAKALLALGAKKVDNLALSRLLQQAVPSDVYTGSVERFAHIHPHS